MGFDMNYKIKVGRKEQADEAQELFFQLGFVKGNCSHSKYPKLVVTDKGGSTGAPLGYYLSRECKEVSFAQLRDLVVLKRNSIEDATHENSFFCYIELSDGWYFFDMDVRKWLRSTGGKPEYYEKLKPIEKKEMKEYLVKSQDGKWRLEIDLVGDPADEVVEIPKGSVKATLCNDFLIFWKDDYLSLSKKNGDTDFTFDEREDYGFVEYMDINDDAILIWQREPIENVEIMKEYLEPMPNGDYRYHKDDGLMVGGDWIEIPEGANGYYQYTENDVDNTFFLKKIGDTYCFANEDNDYSWEWYAGEMKGHELVLWQRESPNDKLASAEQYRQAEVLPFIDDDFDKSDAWIESNVEQTLSERESQYGSFLSVANTTGGLMGVLLNSKNGHTLPYAHQEALHMICSKMARIVNGDYNHLDSWHDIGGYSKLIENLIEEKNGNS